MHPVRGVYLAAVASAILLVGGCREAPPPFPTDIDERSSATANAGPRNLNERFVELGRSIPGFAGMYYRADTVIVRLVDLGAADAARPLLIQVLSSRERFRLFGGAIMIRFEPATFSFQELHTWYQQLEALWEIEGMVFTDIRESDNRIAIGVSSAEARSNAARLVRELGIADDAIEIEDAQPIALETKLLTDSVRPLMGAFAIRAEGLTANVCTSAVNVKLPGDTMIYRLTASHCTYEYGAYDAYQWYQGSELMGYEAYDDYNNCTPANPCLRADAALLRFSNNSKAAFGVLPLPTAFSSQTVDEQHPISIYAEEHFILQGDWVEKLGWAAGFTDGEVYNTCVDHTAFDNGTNRLWKIKCATQAGYGSTNGDSGAAIFFSGWRWDHSTNVAVFYGVHFGENGWFSSIDQIEIVYGNLTLY